MRFAVRCLLFFSVYIISINELKVTESVLEYTQCNHLSAPQKLAATTSALTTSNVSNPLSPPPTHPHKHVTLINRNTLPPTALARLPRIRQWIHEGRPVAALRVPDRLRPLSLHVDIVEAAPFEFCERSAAHGTPAAPGVEGAHGEWRGGRWRVEDGGGCEGRWLEWVRGKEQRCGYMGYEHCGCVVRSAMKEDGIVRIERQCRWIMLDCLTGVEEDLPNSS